MSHTHSSPENLPDFGISSTLSLTYMVTNMYFVLFFTFPGLFFFFLPYFYFLFFRCGLSSLNEEMSETLLVSFNNAMHSLEKNPSSVNMLTKT